MHIHSPSHTCLSIAVLLIAGYVGGAGAAETIDAQAVGRTLPDFLLQDSTGKEAAIADFRDKRVLVFVFLGTQCPIGNQYVPVLNELQEQFVKETSEADGNQVQILGINANRGDSLDDVAKHVDEFSIAFPVLKDAEGKLARFLGVTRMTECFVLDAKRTVRYQGRIDDRYGYTYKKNTAERSDLAEAIKDVLARETVRIATTDVAGCVITLPDDPAPVGKVTFAKQVSRILQNKCQNCHHAGTAAPFSLLTYDDAVNWVAMIKEVVLERRMPPWHADPRYGHFANNRRLTDEELKTIVSWIDQGTPLGDESELPADKEFADGWTIGKPDVIFELPEEVTIQATGVVPYQYFKTPTNFTEDVYIQAAEARPGNRAVTHHIIGFYKVPGEGGEFGALERGWIVGTAPGDMPLVLPPRVALRIPAGADILWQMHYTPTGKEEKDRSQIGLVFYNQEEPPTHFVHKKGIANGNFSIPPGAWNHRVDSEHTFRKDALILSFLPHMHLRGKSFEFQAIYPDGSAEILLSVPRYDFNWQSTYRLAEPHPMPAGSKLHCVAHFDNSKDNPAEIDTSRTVRWGDQTFDEMMIGYTNFIWQEPDGPVKPTSSESAAGGQ